MHDHNNNNSSMMWMMLICCLLPVVFILVASKGRGLGGFSWLAIVAVIIFLAAHFWTMRRRPKGRQNLDSQADETVPTSQNSDDHSQHTHM